MLKQYIILIRIKETLSLYAVNNTQGIAFIIIEIKYIILLIPIDTIVYDIEFLSYFSNNNINFVGNGTPLLGSRYADSLVDAQTVNNVYWVDLGLVGLSFIIGVPAVILLVFLILRSVWINREKDSQFYRLTLITALIPSLFTLMEVFRSGNMLIIGLILYTIEKERLLKQDVL